MAAGRPPCYLRCRDDGRIYGLHDNFVTIGREGCTINLQAISIEKQHAVVEFKPRDGSYMIQDLNTAHGTYINDFRLQNAGKRLCSGDTVRFGHSGPSFDVVLVAPAGPDPAFSTAESGLLPDVHTTIVPLAPGAGITPSDQPKNDTGKHKDAIFYVVRPSLVGVSPQITQKSKNLQHAKGRPQSANSSDDQLSRPADRKRSGKQPVVQVQEMEARLLKMGDEISRLAAFESECYRKDLLVTHLRNELAELKSRQNQSLDGGRPLETPIRDKMANLQNQLGQRSDEIYNLRKEVDAIKFSQTTESAFKPVQVYKSSDDVLPVKDLQIAQLKADLDRTQRLANDGTSLINSLQREFSSKEAQYAINRAEIEKLRRDISIRDAQVSVLSAKVTELEKDSIPRHIFLQKEKEVSVHQQLVGEMESKLQEKLNDIYTMEKNNEVSRALIAKLEQNVLDYQKEVVDLKSRLTQKEKNEKDMVLQAKILEKKHGSLLASLARHVSSTPLEDSCPDEEQIISMLHLKINSLEATLEEARVAQDSQLSGKARKETLRKDFANYFEQYMTSFCNGVDINLDELKTSIGRLQVTVFPSKVENIKEVILRMMTDLCSALSFSMDTLRLALDDRGSAGTLGDITRASVERLAQLEENLLAVQTKHEEHITKALELEQELRENGLLQQESEIKQTEKRVLGLVHQLLTDPENFCHGSLGDHQELHDVRNGLTELMIKLNEAEKNESSLVQEMKDMVENNFARQTSRKQKTKALKERLAINENQFQTEKEYLTNTMADLQQQVEVLTRGVHQLQDENQALTQELEATRSRRPNKDAESSCSLLMWGDPTEISVLDSKLVKARLELENVRQELLGRDDQIIDLTEELGKAKATIVNLSEHHLHQDSHVKAAPSHQEGQKNTEVVENLTHRVGELEAMVEEQQALVAVKRRKAKEMKQLVRVLEEQLRQVTGQGLDMSPSMLSSSPASSDKLNGYQSPLGESFNGEVQKSPAYPSRSEPTPDFKKRLGSVSGRRPLPESSDRNSPRRLSSNSPIQNGVPRLDEGQALDQIERLKDLLSQVQLDNGLQKKSQEHLLQSLGDSRNLTLDVLENTIRSLQERLQRKEKILEDYEQDLRFLGALQHVVGKRTAEVEDLTKCLKSQQDEICYLREALTEVRGQLDEKKQLSRLLEQQKERSSTPASKQNGRKSHLGKRNSLTSKEPVEVSSRNRV